MVDGATWQHYRNSNMPESQLFQVKPDGLEDKDFSFLVIGDPGEGDASQHCLRDQFLFLGQRPDIKFLVISSDVIYPAGAMSGLRIQTSLSCPSKASPNRFTPSPAITTGTTPSKGSLQTFFKRMRRA